VWRNERGVREREERREKKEKKEKKKRREEKGEEKGAERGAARRDEGQKGIKGRNDVKEGKGSTFLRHRSMTEI
jgi:hypothetical protein